MNAYPFAAAARSIRCGTARQAFARVAQKNPPVTPEALRREILRTHRRHPAAPEV